MTDQSADNARSPADMGGNLVGAVITRRRAELGDLSGDARMAVGRWPIDVRICDE